MSELFPEVEGGMRVSGQVLADWLCVSAAAVSQMKAAGKIAAGPDGKYPLKESIAAYLLGMRQRKPEKEKRNLEDELKYWQVENAKTKNQRWRLDYGRQLVIAYLKHHMGTLGEFRRALEGGGNALEAATKLMSVVASTRPDDIVYSVGDDDITEISDDDQG